MRFIYSFILLFLFGVQLSYSSDKVIKVNVGNHISILNLDAYTYLYNTFDTISDLSSIMDKEFKYNSEGLNVGVNDRIHWVRYSFDNPSSQTVELYIDYPYNHINKIIAYAVRDSMVMRKTKVGTYYSYKNKDFVCRNNPIKIELLPGKTEYYVYINHLYLPLRGVAFLLDESQMIQKTAEVNAHVWFWKGIFVFALLVTLVLYILTRVKPFLYYFLLNVSTALFFSMEIGDFVILFDRDIYGNIIDFKHLGNWLILVFSPLFVNSLYPIKQMRPIVWKIMFSLISILPFLWLLGLFPYFKYSMFFYYNTLYLIVVSVFVFVLQIYFTFTAFRNGYKSAIFLFIAYLIYVSSAILNIVLPNLGLLESSMDVYETFIYGSLFEIFVFMALMAFSTYEVYAQKTKLEIQQRKVKHDLISAVVQGQESERNRVGVELHDLVGANISAINLRVNSEDKELKEIIGSTISIVRNLSHGLVTPSIKGGRFCDELRDLCLVFSSDTLKASATFYNWQPVNKPEKMTHIYRIVQELLNNAVKHSEASKVSIQFVINEENLMSVFYEDNGIGFDYDEAVAKKGIGIMNIKNRVELIGATINYDTNKNRSGTIIVITLPIGD